VCTHERAGTFLPSLIPTASGPLAPPHKEAEVSKKHTWVIAALAILVLVPAASPSSQPLVTLGTITVANGSAALTGTLGSQAAHSTVTLNGQPLAVNTSGTFSGTASVNGAEAIDLAISQPTTGVATHFQIPLQGQTVIPGSVLDTLTQAGLSVLQPTVTRGQPVTVSGSVADGSRLVGLEVNGVDVLGQAQQGGSFSVQLPGDTGQVQVAASDLNGTTEVIQAPVFKPFSTSTVSARNAIGIRIVKIRYIRKGVLRTHRIRMIVTVRDRGGRLIRGATIRVTAKGHRLARRPHAARSGAQGRATIALRVNQSAYGKRLVTVTLAKTPHAKARKTSFVRVPAKH
jgi:hypothetical protein